MKLLAFKIRSFML